MINHAASVCSHMHWHNTHLDGQNPGAVRTGKHRAARAAGSAVRSSFLRCYGAEFTASAVRDWLGRIGVKTLYIEPGSPWENGYCESFNGKLRDELLIGEIFYTLKEARILIENWRQHYNRASDRTVHSATSRQRPKPSCPAAPPSSTLRLGQPISATSTAGTLTYPADLPNGAGHGLPSSPIGFLRTSPELA